MNRNEKANHNNVAHGNRYLFISWYLCHRGILLMFLSTMLEQIHYFDKDEAVIDDTEW